MTGIMPGYIKRADLAWYCSHHHNATGENVAYSYSYLFAYAIDLEPGTKSIKLPNNAKIRVLAMSVSEENPTVKPAQPLYDVLPPAATGDKDFSLSNSATSLSITQERRAKVAIRANPRKGFQSHGRLGAIGMAAGGTVTFTPANAPGA